MPIAKFKNDVSSFSHLSGTVSTEELNYLFFLALRSKDESSMSSNGKKIMESLILTTEIQTSEEIYWIWTLY